MQAEILHATEWVNGSIELLQDFSFPHNERNWLSAAYFGLSIRHQAALVTLFERNLPHSALAWNPVATASQISKTQFMHYL